MSVAGYIAVHGGAGEHGTRNEKEVKSSLRKACSEALLSLSEIPSADEYDPNTNFGTNVLSMVERAVVVLEDDEHLNAGYGSNLTIDGTVECDAAIMSGNRQSALFGSVAAVSGVKNPIKLARSILDNSRIPDKLGRIPPMTLAAFGARKFAEGRVQTVPEEALIAPKALDQWKKWKQRLESSNLQDSMNVGDNIQTSLRDVQDTAGAVAFHAEDGTAAAVVFCSNILEELERRQYMALAVGRLRILPAVYPVRIDFLGREEETHNFVGTGEHIVGASIARKIGEELHTLGDRQEKDPHEVLNRVLIEFWEYWVGQGEESPSVGVILLVATKGEDEATSIRLWCGFTTASMAIGYASLQNPKAKAVILRHPNPKSEGRPRIFITALSL